MESTAKPFQLGCSDEKQRWWLATSERNGSCLLGAQRPDSL
jgi:hypothetical protein